MVEIWDAYDRNFNKISDVTLVRGNSIPNGMYHLVCEIIVKHKDETYLIMQRDFRKHFGGKWELTSGGSALRGETPIEGALRELREETGIISTNLQEIRRIVHDIHQSLYVVFLCVTDLNKEFITLQEGETINYKWISRNELLSMSDESLISSRAIKLINVLNI